MVKFLAIVVFGAVALMGRSAAPATPPGLPASPLAALQASAEKQNADWETLAQGMEAKIGRMLPCDPRVRSTIGEASRASEARLAAMSQYLKAEIAMAKGDTEAAKAAVAAQADGNKDLDTERAEAEQERIAVEAELSELEDSEHRLAALDPAQKKLADIAAMIRERAARTQQLAGEHNTLTVPLGDLLVAYQTWQAALEDEQVALAVEQSRWSEYYAARLDRAQTECSIIHQPVRRKK